MSSIFRLFWTVRHLSVRQIFFRTRRIIRRRWQRATQAKAPQITAAQLSKHNPLWRGLSGPDVRSVQRGEAEPIVENQFTFLNHTATFETNVGWHDTELSHLFRYHLHYFHYVLPLLVTHHAGQPQAYGTFKRLAQDWIENNQRLKGDGWHPYTLSLRIVNWLHAVNGFAPELEQDPAFNQTLLNSLFGQCRYLATDLEHDVRGNHLLANLRALIWAGIAFEGEEAKRWLQTGLHWLEKEVAEQVLADGAHFERSPGYHVVVLQDLFEIAIYVDRNTPNVPAWLSDAVQKMARYLEQIVRPDDQVPLLKDTAQDAYLAPTELLGAISGGSSTNTSTNGWYAQLLGMKGQSSVAGDASVVHLKHAGHTVFKSDRDWGIIDHGLPCPSYLPAHAQADLFTFEYFVDGLPIVVDSGIFEYTPGKWRDHFRSTAAHNTIEVAGQNSTDVWHSFRAARRATPKIIAFESTPTQMTLTVEHNGYGRLKPSVTHRRTYQWQSGQSLVIQDTLLGTGTIDAVSRIHLHRSLTPQQITATRYQLTPHLTISGDLPFQEDHGWHSPRFGEKHPNICLKQTLSGDMPLQSEITFQLG